MASASKVSAMVRDGRRGHPVLWRRALFPRLLTLQGDTGARALLDAPDLLALPVETGDDGAFADFDTPARLAAFRDAATVSAAPR